ncbi:hypothetical protein XELAEV_18030949mg [Xenopus laevis]|uniref:Uncharacterized protein n=1 Tax=Xenopus laevis TaxID=8355 RepID=A0A974CMW0_XENLA|nr:hypothetical protein XELAEV_18030949mg [Xenopus laevis]
MVYTLFKTLEKQMSYKLLLCWGILTLEKYISLKWIPRGLRLKKYPTFAREDFDFANKWNDVLSKCSMEIMGLIINHKQQELSSTREGIKESQVHLTTLDKSPGFDRLDMKLKEYLLKLESSVSAQKKCKLKRDKMDNYNDMVYMWNKPKSILRNRSKNNNRNKSVSFSSVSSDSGEETSFCTEDIESTSLCSKRRNPTEADLEDPETSKKFRKTKTTMERMVQTEPSGRKKTRRGGGRLWRGTLQAEDKSEKQQKDLLNVVNISSVSLTSSQEQILRNGLSFDPTHLFRLFNILLDVNKHFGPCGTRTNYDHTKQGKATQQLKVDSKGSLNYFQEQCCLTDLNSLQRESTAEAQGNLCTPMDTFQDLVEGDLMKLSSNRSKRVPENISSEERIVIKSLKLAIDVEIFKRSDHHHVGQKIVRFSIVRIPITTTTILKDWSDFAKIGRSAREIFASKGTLRDNTAMVMNITDYISEAKRQLNHCDTYLKLPSNPQSK